jgi:hypothetical protein
MIYRTGSMSRDMVKIIPRRGVSKNDTSMDIYLESGDLATMYERWQSARWESPVIVGGGEQMITCDMVLRVDRKDLEKVYGKKLSGTLIEAANKGASN